MVGGRRYSQRRSEGPPPRTECLTVWSIQPLGAYEDLLRAGTLAADPSRGSGPDFEEPYAWMRQQTAKRVPGYGGGPLWWAYAKKPDLRSYRWRLIPDEWVRLELNLPREDVLLSDEEAWYTVLNRWYCSYNEAEEDVWEAKLKALGANKDSLPAELEAEMEASWERIFDPEAPIGWYASGEYQATFEFLHLSAVRRVTHFRGSYKARYYGPNAIGPWDLPPLEGYGDPVRVGDRVAVCSMDMDGTRTEEQIYTVRGYEPSHGAYRLYMLDEHRHPTSFSTEYRNYWRREFRVLGRE